jgi:hypothetical protein
MLTVLCVRVLVCPCIAGLIFVVYDIVQCAHNEEMDIVHIVLLCALFVLMSLIPPRSQCPNVLTAPGIPRWTGWW